MIMDMAIATATAMMNTRAAASVAFIQNQESTTQIKTWSLKATFSPITMNQLSLLKPIKLQISLKKE